ncbi:MAG: hypothetical protein D6766_06840, partial [Verrucomicrobia bacterium]
FQVERQLLADGAVRGYTRLWVVSPDRLAERVLAELGGEVPARLGESGRTMVLRALLGRLERELEVFGAAARLPGLARQLSRVLRELRDHRVTPARLRELAAEQRRFGVLAGKLRDLARLAEAFDQWGQEQGVRDEAALLEAATQTLRRHASRTPSPWAAALWLDGFAEMTPQEQDLVAALTLVCERATLAFCLDPAEVTAAGERSPERWFSTWHETGRTWRQLWGRIERLGAGRVEVERLDRAPDRGRFAANPALAHLERCWETAEPWKGEPTAAVRWMSCATPEEEVRMAAREIRRWVRRGGRYREVAVLVRSLEPYKEPVQRLFGLYGIPHFLDSREPVAHHPLAELTRRALRLWSHEWRSEDWFALLKTGLLPAGEAEVDELENEALARGWEGSVWRRPLECPDRPDLARRLEPVRARCSALLEGLGKALGVGSETGPAPTGRELAVALHRFWKELRVDGRLEVWAEAAGRLGAGAGGAVMAQVHRSVLGVMIEWLRELAFAFGEETMPLREWLPVVEAGLAGLTVGVVPPALDQVLVGAVDRSRNPELRLAFVLGCNEGVFPAPPRAGSVLTEADREALAAAGVELGPDLRRSLAREAYLAYIAFTRPNQRLVVSWAATDEQGRELNPSIWVDRLRGLFPGTPVETFEAVEPVHPVELGPRVLAWARRRLLAGRPFPPWLEGAEWAAVRELAGWLPEPEEKRGLSPAAAAALHGSGPLQVSPSALEDFAACPFRFWVRRALRAKERRVWETDARRLGTFGHEVLARYHLSLEAQGRKWQDLTEDEAEALVRAKAAEVAAAMEEGLLERDPRGRLELGRLTGDLVELVRATTRWLRAGVYPWQPAAVELAFGFRDGSLPPWRVPLPSGGELLVIGKVDRLDLREDPDGGGWLALIIDYKSSPRTLKEKRLRGGVDLQLPIYLRAVEMLPVGETGGLPHLEGQPVRGAGMFFVGLRPKADQAKSGRAARDEGALAGKRWPHRGRYDATRITEPMQQSGPLAGPQSGDCMSEAAFRTLVEGVDGVLVRLGEAIRAGRIEVAPYREGTETACDHCPCAGICRIDPWRHTFRSLGSIWEPADVADGAPEPAEPPEWFAE